MEPITYVASTAFPTSSDTDLRQMARTLGREFACRWRRDYSEIPRTADADDIAALVFGSDAADRLGVRDIAFKEQLRKLASDFDARDYMFFDPATEPPLTTSPALTSTRWTNAPVLNWSTAFKIIEAQVSCGQQFRKQ